ncbi:MAG: 3-oxoacyl-[acyl-carrier-protein] synthase [Gaiellaceae bacterium]|jgi:3-oxoacyl-[acyl-carrier-protein] synthase II|nr:3-oxoacyl-[acyl-carrier-protein] synthase [Gaiellaceae bacterium]
MSSNGQRRVVITGVGAVTPLGNDAETSWERLLAGESGAGPITQFDSADYAVHFACEVKDFDPANWIERKQARRMDRFAQLILAAARQAEADSGVDVKADGDRIGASIATGIGGLKSFQDCYDTLRERGPDRVNPFAIPCIIPNMGAGWVSMELGTRGPLSSECTACAASNMAIGQGLDDIRLGRAEVMFCGGTESAINEVGIAGFGAMRALSRRNDDPARASRPFDAGRDGFVMGEAGAVIVLEELERARARGAKIYAEVAGYGLSSDAKHVTEPDPTGENPARAMQNAFADAGIDPGEIDYINAHGTSTPLGDAAETRVIKLALGEENARQTPVSSTKGATGHCLGAAGAVEAIFSTLAIRDGKLPPTINQDVPDPECDLDYIPNESRDADVRVAVSNSFGFGGHNASIVLKRFED